VIFDYDFSPDGKSLVMTRGSDNNDLVLLRIGK
jgi:hypothetical protein